MVDINLIFLGDKFGGNGACTSHLALLLKKWLDLDVAVWKVGKKTLNRHYPMRIDLPVTYGILSMEEAVRQLRDGIPTLLTYVADYKKSTNVDDACELVRAGANYIIHDHRAVYMPMVEEMNMYGRCVVVCGDRLADYLVDDIGFDNVALLYQPYVRSDCLRFGTPIFNGIYMTRIDFGKKTDIVLAANQLVHVNKAVKICGRINSRYGFFKLDKEFPGWQDDYHIGTPETLEISPVTICSLGRFVVDMSPAFGDLEGGRTQYSFMEAMDSGSCLVVNRDWLKHPGEMEEDVNCMAVNDAEELAWLLEEYEPPKLNYDDVLNAHDSFENACDWNQIILDSLRI